MVSGETGTGEWPESLVEGGAQLFGLTKSSGLNVSRGGLVSHDLDTRYKRSHSEVMAASLTV